MAADVAQCESSNIKCYASAFSNILITQFNKNKNLYINNNNKKYSNTYNLQLSFTWFSYQIFVYNSSKRINNKL